MELEWVTFSAMPSSCSLSMTSRDFTSSCRASSLIRILLIFTCFVYLPLQLADLPHSGFGDFTLDGFRGGLTICSCIFGGFRRFHHRIRACISGSRGSFHFLRRFVFIRLRRFTRL